MILQPIMIASLDTLQTAKRPKEAGFNEPQAEAPTAVRRDVQRAGQAQLATKSDPEEAIAVLDAKIERIAAEFQGRVRADSLGDGGFCAGI